MPKDNTLLIIGALGVGAFLLRDSFKGVSDVVSNVGTTTTGIATGVSQTGQAIGSITGEIGQSFKAVADLQQGIFSGALSFLNNINISRQRDEPNILESDFRVAESKGFIEAPSGVVEDSTITLRGIQNERSVILLELADGRITQEQANDGLRKLSILETQFTVPKVDTSTTATPLDVNRRIEQETAEEAFNKALLKQTGESTIIEASRSSSSSKFRTNKTGTFTKVGQGGIFRASR